MMTHEQHLQKGFSAGYQLQKQDAELAKTLSNAIKDKTHPYVQGFDAGVKEFTKEQSKDKSNFNQNYFNKIKDPTTFIPKDKDQDKGIEP